MHLPRPRAWIITCPGEAAFFKSIYKLWNTNLIKKVQQEGNSYWLNGNGGGFAVPS